jgi:hypothetical protein
MVDYPQNAYLGLFKKKGASFYAIGDAGFVVDSSSSPAGLKGLMLAQAIATTHKTPKLSIPSQDRTLMASTCGWFLRRAILPGNIANTMMAVMASPISSSRTRTARIQNTM